MNKAMKGMHAFCLQQLPNVRIPALHPQLTPTLFQIIYITEVFFFPSCNLIR